MSLRPLHFVGLLLILAGCPATGEPAYPESCADGEALDAQDDDALGCVPRDCGAGPWGDIERDGDTIHVAPWGDSGDGSEARPFSTLAEGVEEAIEQGGGRVALAAGGYEGLRLEQDAGGVELAGRCTGLVTVGGALDAEPIFVVSESAVTLRDLTVGGTGSVGLRVQGAGGVATLRDVIVRDITPAADAPTGVGVVAQTGGRLDARELTVTGALGIAMACSEPGTRVDLLDVTIEDTREGSGGSGWGLSSNSGCQVVGERVTVQRNVETGIFVSGGGRVFLTDSEVPDNLPNSAGEGGCGMVVVGQSVFAGDNVRFLGNQGVGVFIDANQASTTLEGVRIAGTLPAPNGRLGGLGLVVQGDVFFEGNDLEIADNQGHGMFVSGTGVDVLLENASIRGTRPGAGLDTGRGLTVARGARVTATDLVIEDNVEVGLLATSVDTRVTLTGGRVGTTSTGPTALAAGIVIQDYATLEADGLLAEANEGPALYVPTRGTATLTSSLLTGNAFAGVVVLGGDLTMIDGEVSGTREHPSEDGGAGVFIAEPEGGDPQVTVQGTAFSGLVGPALYVLGGGDVTMTDCDVSDSGSWPSLPGGILARGGGAAGSLVVSGNRFADLSGDAIVLDRAPLVLQESDTGPNRFENLDGVALYAQCGEGGTPPTVTDGSVEDPSCRTSARPLGPAVEYVIRVQETGVIQ
ncbi:MAG: right-handed parallel beta-helix repeat-containing protein [Deltaproteobacteria bacterium]|nr:right-handed parallel beta-helix repeat-containing protein [Deltaproteobacteria bacterium]